MSRFGRYTHDDRYYTEAEVDARWGRRESHPSLEYVRSVTLPTGVRSPNEILCDGRTLWVESFNDQKVQPLDIVSDPSNPSASGLTAITTGLAGPSDLVIRGNRILVRSQTDTSGNNLKTWDISNRASIVAGQTLTATYGQRMGIGRKWLMLGGKEVANQEAVQVFDVRNPTSIPAATGTLIVRGSRAAGSVATHRNVAYIGDDDSGNEHFAVALRDTQEVAIVKVDSSGVPTLVATLTGMGTTTTPLVCRPPYLYVGGYGSSVFTVVDVRNPASCYKVSSLTTSVGQVEDLQFVEDGYVVMFGRDSRKVGLIDVRVAATPVEAATIDLSAYEGLRLQRGTYYNGYIYVTGDNAASPTPGMVHVVKVNGRGLPAQIQPQVS